MKPEIELDKIKGSLYGGAVGDALGYAIEFLEESEIFSKYGKNGITDYDFDKRTGKALISDDTQMTLFTATGIISAKTAEKITKQKQLSRDYVRKSYHDWLITQSGISFYDKEKIKEFDNCISWLNYIPEMYHLRAPGRTCISSLLDLNESQQQISNYIAVKRNNSKGCGGIMRTAPVGLSYSGDIKQIDMEGSQISAITHCHSMGYMPSAVITHIINRILFPTGNQTLKEIVIDAKNTVAELFECDEHISELENIIDLSVQLSENNDSDLENIHRIGEGWIAEETMGIAVYCSLRHQNNFSDAVTASVNHRGDSDSTGAVTGNILGAWLGYEKIESKWKKNLELAEVILEIAEDIYKSYEIGKIDLDETSEWYRKYIKIKNI